jgi:glycosyltransferase involved in cell wall biosynthesis
MRVGIDYRILSVGPALVTRGMGRYTQQQLRAVLDADDRNEYVLLVNRGNDLSLIVPEVLEAENTSIEVYTPPRRGAPQESGASPERDPRHTDVLLRLAEDYEAWMGCLDLDVYHATTPFLLEYPLLLQFDTCPMVATFYDAIPLIFAEHYYGTTVFESLARDHYLRTLELVKRAERILAISDAAGRDAVQECGIPPERIDRAWPLPDAVFRRLPEHLLRKLLAGLEHRLRLPARCVLTVTYPHYAKNLETLLEAYGGLPADVRTELPLVICCYLSDDSRRLVMRLAEQAGIADDIVLTGVVSDAELCALYNRATVVVHPSRYEGFGLPIVEAMACGAPVVTTTSSSMPEAAGDAAILVDPDDVAGFTDALARLARDPDLAAELRDRGFRQVQRFNPRQLADATLRCYERAAHPIPTPASDRLRLAVWTPLPPAQSGIADYSAELLEGLSPHCELEVFVDDGYLPANECLDRYPVRHFTAFGRRQAQHPFDAVVYQVGGSMFHHYMSEALRAHPGIVVLHDLMWSHVLYTWAQEQGDGEAFRTTLAELEGRAALEEFDALDPADMAGLWDFLRAHPMLEPVIGGSLAQIVHLDAAADQLLAAHPGANPWVVPMGVDDPCAGDVTMTPRLARCTLKGIPLDAFVVGTYGIVHPSKRLEACIEGFAGLAARYPDALLLIVGRALQESYAAELEKLAANLGLGGRVQLTGHVERTKLDAYLKAADVIVNLRTPLNTHMSATLMRAIATGRPVIINDLPEWRFLPDGAVWRVPADGEVPALTEALTSLAGDPGLRSRMAADARTFYEREGTIGRMAERYLEVVGRTAVARTAGEPGRTRTR